MRPVRLFEGLHLHAQSVALLDASGIATTYQELVDQSEDIGLLPKRRSLILLLCSNTVDAVIGYVGFVRAGHVCVMASASLSSDRLDNLVKQFRPNYVFAEPSAFSQLRCKVVGTVGKYALVQIDNDEIDLFDELALLMSTSGSTGSPLMVRQSYANTWSNADAIARSLNLTKSDRAVTTLPMNYTYGLSIIHSQLYVGGSIVMSDSPLSHRGFWQTLEVTQPTYFGGVPYSYQMLDRLGVSRLSGSSIRMLTQAGGRLAPELATSVSDQVSSMDIEFYIMYGQTEATARMSVLHSTEVRVRPTSIGKALSGGTFRVLDLDTGKPVGVGEVGELEYSGPNVALGYAESVSDLIRGDDWNGVLRTGDLATFDENGFFYIVGRRKRFVKLFGNRVSLDHVESHLSSLGITAACGLGDDALRVYVEGDVDAAVVHRAVASFVGVHESGVHLIQVEKLPRSESGKIEYANLERLTGL